MTKINVAKLLDRFVGEELAVSVLCVRIARTAVSEGFRTSCNVDCEFMLAVAEAALQRTSGVMSKGDERSLMTRLAEALREAEAAAASEIPDSATHDAVRRLQ